MNDSSIKETVLRILSEKYPKIIKESLEIKFYQTFKDRIDTFGRFQDENGVYEFTLSYEKGGKVKRLHVNLIIPIKVKKDIEDKVYKE